MRQNISLTVIFDIIFSFSSEEIIDMNEFCFKL